jgi:pre-mRNA-splicing factor 18
VPHTFNISPQEATRRLRAKGEPIRLFGETDKETRLRLRALELIEERGERFGQNDFMRALAGAESGVSLEQLEKERMQREKEVRAAKDGGDKDDAKDGEQEGDSGKKSSRRTGEGIGMESLLDLGLIRKDMMKVYPIIYYTLKGLLEEWGKSLADRPSQYL